jgi:diaminohydroxyphosphoribosylaminopyrimidine deaminase / 5-amino-6-(5-phosphoribosylamino)uracil reductase
MSQPTDAGPAQSLSPQSISHPAWSLVLAAAGEAEEAERRNRAVSFVLGGDGRLEAMRDGDDRLPSLAWRPGRGWTCLLPSGHESRALIDLYLPVCSATSARPLTIGHLGESLDGFIATHAGESQWVTGPENVLHMHRLRALCDVVVVGPGTVAADDPLLTTRLVSGPNPLRVVLDPSRRLRDDHRVFTDSSAETLYVCARDLVAEGERRFGEAEVIGVAGGGDTIDVAELMQLLRARGCARVFVEGGGVTMSMFLQADALDRLQMTIAPLLIGDGRAAIRLPAPAALGDCHRPAYRVFRMGGDVLFDCDLRTRHEGSPPAAPPPITRII